MSASNLATDAREGVDGDPGSPGFDGGTRDVSFRPAASGSQGKMAAGVGFRGRLVRSDGGSVISMGLGSLEREEDGSGVGGSDCFFQI
jgi:hypothetical protein